jgi:pyruvate dehydrogenase E2 component (dihydrolipoamide acetyltransferase)
MSMPHPIAIPKLGLTMVDCTLVEWAKADGEKIAKGQTLYTIETDKISTEVEADSDGYLERTVAVDTLLPVGAVIGFLHADQSAVGKGSAVAASVPVVAAQRETSASAQAQHDASLTMRVDADGGRTRLLASPVARRVAAEAGLDLTVVPGTGPGAAILLRDVRQAMESGRKGAASAATQAASVPTRIAASTIGQPRRRPLAGMRKAIANRMMQSLQGSAQMTGFGSIDMAEAVKLRAALLSAEQKIGARISYTDIILKACASALAEMPTINASIVGEEIVEWDEVNIGLAVSLDDGLIVPVLRNLDRMTLADISRTRQDLIARARAGTLERRDIDGGTFSLSNFGSYGGDFETPILNPPQSALLGIGQITDEPVVRDGQIVIRPMMRISLTFDHRLIDGALAGQFRARVKSFLENPALLMATMS